MLQTFEEIWHFRNAWIILNCLGICRKCYLLDNAQILWNGTVLVKNYFKTKLGYPNQGRSKQKFSYGRSTKFAPLTLKLVWNNSTFPCIVLFPWEFKLQLLDESVNKAIKLGNPCHLPLQYI